MEDIGGPHVAGGAGDSERAVEFEQARPQVGTVCFPENKKNFASRRRRSRSCILMQKETLRQLCALKGKITSPSLYGAVP